jgi:hypothetical protein
MKFFILFFLLFQVSVPVYSKPEFRKCGVYKVAGRLICDITCEMHLHSNTLSETKIEVGGLEKVKAIFNDKLVQMSVLQQSKKFSYIDGEKSIELIPIYSESLKREPRLLKEEKCKK